MINITYQGIAGSYTSQALENICNRYKINCNKIENEYFFKELFEEINEDTLALIPVENSIAGNVVQTTSLFLIHDVEIIAETKLVINHCLICPDSCKDENVTASKEVFSHIQALTQCSEFLEEEHLIPRRANDTAGAVKHIVSNDDCNRYAIGPEFATHLYGGKVLRRNIQNKNGNTTRFLLVKKKDIKYDLEKNLPKKDKSSFIMELKHSVGQLYEVLKLFKRYDINIARIESQPHPDKHFTYMFLVDVEANIEDDKYNHLIDEIAELCITFKFLGSYPKWDI